MTDNRMNEPTEAQIEAAARALFEDPHMSADYTWAELVEDDPTRAEIWRIDARRALTAAGVAPQEPKCEHGIALIDLCQFADQVANDESDPQVPSEWGHDVIGGVGLRAERDAALAAIERVRVEADAYAEQPDVMEPCGAVAQALRTALDGAPEPETPELFPGTNAALDRLTVRKAAPAEAFCIEHGNFHAVELGDPTCEFEDGLGEPVDGEKP